MIPKHPLIRAGIVLGLGFGGFADGIVLHQILGWHHLVCVTAHCQAASIEQLKLQNTQDGFFHLVLWAISLVGTAMLFRAARHAGPEWSGRVLLGSMLTGWGLFQLVEGIVDHHLLGIHHVLPGHPQQFVFDMLFLAVGVLFLMVGARLVYSPTCGASDPDVKPMGEPRSNHRVNEVKISMNDNEAGDRQRNCDARVAPAARELPAQKGGL